jgi:hypothetical protein
MVGVTTEVCGRLTMGKADMMTDAVRLPDRLTGTGGSGGGGGMGTSCWPTGEVACGAACNWPALEAEVAANWLLACRVACKVAGGLASWLGGGVGSRSSNSE